MACLEGHQPLEIYTAQYNSGNSLAAPYAFRGRVVEQFTASLTAAPLPLGSGSIAFETLDNLLKVASMCPVWICFVYGLPMRTRHADCSQVAVSASSESMPDGKCFAFSIG